MKLESCLVLAVNPFHTVIGIVKTLMKIKIFQHIGEKLSQLLDLLHYSMRNLLGKVKILDCVVVDGVVLARQDLNVFLDHVFSFLFSFQKVKHLNSLSGKIGIP